MSRLFYIALYCFFHLACSFDWRESIAWRDSYAELSSVYALLDFAIPSWTTKISKIHVEEDDYRYYIEFSTDFAQFGLPLDYIVAMRVWQANPLERLLVWNSLFPLANLTINNTDTSLHKFHRLSYPYALSLQNEIHVLSLVQSRLTGFITSDFDTTVNNRRLERVMCGMIVTVFKHMETILRALDRDLPTTSAATLTKPTTPRSDSPAQTLRRVVASVVPADDAAYQILRSSFMDYVNVQLQPLLDLHRQQQQEYHQQQQQQQQQEHQPSSKVTILEEVRVNESFYQVITSPSQFISLSSRLFASLLYSLLASELHIVTY